MKNKITIFAGDALKICAFMTILMFAEMESFAQSSTENYILSETMLSNNGDNRSIKSVQYYDGLGRPTLLASGGMGSSGKYVYTLKQYDMCGLDSVIWLPVIGGTTPTYMGANQVPGMSNATYGDSYAYSTIEHDAIGRTISTSTPGAAWYSVDARTTVSFTSNVANSVKRYTTSSFTSDTFTLNGFYSMNSLYAESSNDEEGHEITVFKDAQGRTILERKDGSNDTYFVYHGDYLRFVLPPEYQNTHDMSLVYKYKYDDRGRCIEKKLPDSSSIQYCYDSADRLVCLQDARLQSENKFRIFFYDRLGRLIIQGLSSTSVGNNTASMNVTMNSSVGQQIDVTGYYVVSSSDFSDFEIEIVNYYDNYVFLSNSSFSTYIATADLSNGSHANATSLLTGQIVSSSDGNYLCAAFYYDEKGNVIERKETLLNGAVLSTATSYSFTDKPLISTMTLTRKGVTRTVKQTNVYDLNSDRLLSQQHKYGTKTAVTTAAYSYNDLGQIQALTQHNGALSTSYSYDVHGWLTDISSVVSGTGTPLFQEKLKYVDATRGMGYNGNISESRWISGSSNSSYRYKYTYDGMDRLTGAAFYAGGPINNDNASFIDDLGSVSVQYNANSSITSLIRRGQLDNGYGAIDNLVFTYSGNQLSRIAEYVPPILHEGSFDFKDNALNVSGNEYLYDACGSLTADANKGITHIDYDQLGNPVRIQFTDRSYTENVYAADGRKLKTSHITAVPSSNHLVLGEIATLNPAQILSVDSTEYMDNFLFDNGSFKEYHFDGGYLTPTGSPSTYRYYVKDHLGSNRILVNNNGTIQQETQYYPYGGIHHFSTDQGTQKFKYNGKELDLMHGLNLYDYGARLYDPLIGQFTSIDPLCEKYYSVSPYAYCAGNPVNRIDLHGDSIIFLDKASVDGIYNALLPETNLSMKFNQGILIPESIQQIASNSQNSFLQDLYNISINSQMVEIETIYTDSWSIPTDIDYAKEYNNGQETPLFPLGRTIVGNLGQTLYPKSSDEDIKSTNNNIRININAKGNINHRSCGIAHEFGHVILYLNGLPHSHQYNADFIYGRQWNVMKKFGYDYLESPTEKKFR